MAKYVFHQTVKYRRRYHPPGTAIEIDPKVGDAVAKRIGGGPVTERPAAATHKKPSGEALTAAIVPAINTLDAGIPEHFTRAGLPNVVAIEKVLGYDISMAERDAAWARVKTAANRQ